MNFVIKTTDKCPRCGRPLALVFDYDDPRDCFFPALLLCVECKLEIKLDKYPNFKPVLDIYIIR